MENQQPNSTNTNLELKDDLAENNLPNPSPIDPPPINVAVATTPTTPATIDQRTQAPPPQNQKQIILFLAIAIVGLVLAGALMWMGLANKSRPSIGSPNQDVNEEGSNTTINSNQIDLNSTTNETLINNEKLPTHLQTLVGLSPGETYVRMVQLQKEASNFAEYLAFIDSFYHDGKLAGLSDWSEYVLGQMYEQVSNDWLYDEQIWQEFNRNTLTLPQITSETIDGDIATVAARFEISTQAIIYPDGVPTLVDGGTSTSNISVMMKLDPSTQIWISP